MKSKIVENFIEKWHENNISYCHWKSIDHLKEAYEGVTDLDILVDFLDMNEAEKQILDSGFIRMKTSVLRTYPGVEDYISYDSVNDKFIHLHLHYQLVLGDRWVKAYRLPIEKSILERRVWNDEYKTWVVSAEDELVMFIARMTVKFKKPFQNKKVLNEIDDIKKRFNENYSLDLVTDDYPKSFIILSKEILSNQILTISTNIARKDFVSFRRMSYLKFKFLSSFRFLYRVFVELNRRKLNNFSFGRRQFSTSGFVVAFVGMDGSGKTSAIERNARFFAKQINTKSVFLGSGKSGAPWYRKLIFNIMGSKPKLKSHKKIKTDKKYPFYYLVWVSMFLNDKLKRLNQIFKYKSNSCMVLVDRWPQATVENTFDGTRLQSNTNNTFFMNYTKKLEKNVLENAETFYPDIIFRFKVSPEKSLERKPDELTLEQAKEAEKNIDIIKWPSYSKIIDIDSNSSIDDVDKAVRKAIWNTLINK
jgi:thymidylate kinase